MQQIKWIFINFYTEYSILELYTYTYTLRFFCYWLNYSVKFQDEQNGLINSIRILLKMI